MVDGDDPHRLLLAHQGELELLGGCLRETARLKQAQGRWDSASRPEPEFMDLYDRIISTCIEGRASDQRPPATQVSFSVLARETSYTCAISLTAVRILGGCIEFLLDEVDGPELHTITGFLPDELRTAYFALFGYFPKGKLRY